MKNKFIRIVSPASSAIAVILDIAVIYFGYFAIIKLTEKASLINIAFAVIEAASVILAIFYTREVFRHGIIFREDSFELTALDENNFFSYSDIKSVETQKDTKASLKKNFVDRYSKLIISLNDESTVTIELGMTTKRKLFAIENEINKRKDL